LLRAHSRPLPLPQPPPQTPDGSSHPCLFGCLTPLASNYFLRFYALSPIRLPHHHRFFSMDDFFLSFPLTFFLCAFFLLFLETVTLTSDLSRPLFLFSFEPPRPEPILILFFSLLSRRSDHIEVSDPHCHLPQEPSFSSVRGSFCFKFCPFFLLRTWDLIVPPLWILSRFLF